MISSHQENIGDDVLLFRFRLENYKFFPCIIGSAFFMFLFLRKREKRLVKLLFFLHFIPMDPDPQTKMNADLTGSKSTSLTSRTQPEKNNFLNSYT